MTEPHESCSSKKKENTRMKVKSRKKTVGITLHQNLVKRARKRNLNISRITEQALLSILDYLDTQNDEKSSGFLSTGSFLKAWWTGLGQCPRLNPRRIRRTCFSLKLFVESHMHFIIFSLFADQYVA